MPEDDDLWWAEYLYDPSPLTRYLTATPNNSHARHAPSANNSYKSNNIRLGSIQNTHII